MARFTISGVTSAAPTSTNPGASLYAIANVPLKVYRVAVVNTSASSSFDVALTRLTTAATQGSGLTENNLDGSASGITAQGTGFQSHTSTGPSLGGQIERFTLAAASGSGIVWTYDTDYPLIIPAGTANGLGILSPAGTPQVCTFTFEWAE